MGLYSLMSDQQESESAPVPGSAPEDPGSGLSDSGLSKDSPMQPTQNGLVTPPSNAPQRIPHWLQQAERFLRVIVRMYLGLLVCLAPWFPAAWDSNPLFAASPTIVAFVTQGWVRGVVSGLGLLNLYIALRDAIGDPADRG